jgi:hypothetical protein
VPWGTLRRLGGSRDDADCRLPDGSIVGLDECQKWLNESVAGGWVVGVTLQSDRPGQSLIAATRKRAEAEAQQKKECRERGGEITTGAGIQKGL